MDLSSIGWTFLGKYEPAVFNLMLAVACVYKEQKNFPEIAKRALEEYEPDEKNYGRLLCYKNEKKDISVIVDYAHEKNSIRSVGLLARKIAKNKTIGIVSFNPDRTDEQIKSHAKGISNIFDITIIFDKIDGVSRKPDKDRRKVYYRETGEVSELIYNEMRSHTKEPNKIYKKTQEKEALRKAHEITKKGDVIIHIFGNDPSKSIKMVKDILKVEHCSPTTIMSSLKTLD